MRENATPAPRTRGANGRYLPRAAEPAPAPVPEAASEPEAEPIDAPPPLELYLVRHADAGDSALWTGIDAERPLSKKGRRQAKALARLLKDLRLRVDAVITSPLVRAVQTAKPIAKATGVQLFTDERLGYDFGKRELVALVGQLGPGMQRVVLVGHDPGCSSVASMLIGADTSLSKGTLVRIDLAGREVRAGSGELRWLIPPDAVAG
jgi:phosphohistidine phosphatase